jgi:hypothetical protein
MYKSIGKSCVIKNIRFYAGINIHNYKSICIKYFNHDTLIGTSLFEEPTGKEYLYKFYIDLWFIRFEIEGRRTKIGETSPETSKVGDGDGAIFISTTGDPFEEKNK